jgi:porphobilinogen deaminase
VLLRIEKGQFTCDSISGGAIAVKFDEGSVRTYTCRTPSGGATNVISIQPSRRFVEALKRSHRATIGAEFFTEGEQQLAFNTTGLRW